jgi:hypothetical protein
MRGKDGRSLARALIVLVLLSLFAGGLNTGASAAGGDLVICAVDGRGDGGAPVSHLAADCCVAGVMPLGMGLASAPPVLDAPTLVATIVPPPLAHADVAGPPHGAALARGPPSLA